MPNQKAETALQLLEKLSKASDMFRKVQSKQMHVENLTNPQFGALFVLKKYGSVPLKKISDEMMVTGANITCVVDNLEKEGFVKRIHSIEDRRVINAELTPKGKAKVEQLLPSYRQNAMSMVSKLKDDEQKTLLNLLEKLVD